VKILRREQNKRAYLRHTADKIRLAPTWPTIPSAVRQQAALPLPKQSHFFRLEYRTQEEISDTDSLAKWDFYPPYNMPDGSIGNGRLEAIVEQVHGRRLREQYQHEVRCLRCYEISSDTQILEEIDRDINTYLTTWNELKHILRTLPPSHINHTMGEHLLQWKARRIVDLLEDWRVVKQGRVNHNFTCLFHTCW
jgi:hypothetical protein